MYDHVWFMIIDALRFDFVKYNRTNSYPSYYENNVPIIEELVHKETDSNRLFCLLSDAPTVTMQRLKALTTGSLPTFIDMKDNFQSEEIHEDSWVSQLWSHNRPVFFTGDDTWTRLYPTKLTEQHPYPSFDVFD